MRDALVWIIWGGKAHSKLGPYLLVAAHRKEHEKKKLLLFACLPSLSLEISSISWRHSFSSMLLRDSNTDWKSAEIFSLMAWISWSFLWETVIIGLAGSQYINHSSKSHIYDIWYTIYIYMCIYNTHSISSVSPVPSCDTKPFYTKLSDHLCDTWSWLGWVWGPLDCRFYSKKCTQVWCVNYRQSKSMAMGLLGIGHNSGFTGKLSCVLIGNVQTHSFTHS